jgi:hypothetical protein
VEQNAGVKHNRKDRGDGRRSSSAEQKQTNQITTTRADKKEDQDKKKNPYLRAAKGCIRGHVQDKIQCQIKTP